MSEKPLNNVDDSNEVERLYRRNTLFFASVIAVYSLAEGNIGSDVSVGIAKITFNNPTVIEYSMVMTLLYFCWRHLLVSKVIRLYLVDRAIDGVTLPPRVIRALVKKTESKREELRFIRDEQAVKLDFKGWKLCGIGFCSLRISYNYAWRGGKTEQGEEELDVFSYFGCFVTLNLKYRLSWLKNIAIQTHFGDGVLPVSLTVIAIVLYATHNIFR